MVSSRVAIFLALLLPYSFQLDLSRKTNKTRFFSKISRPQGTSLKALTCDQAIFFFFLAPKKKKSPDRRLWKRWCSFYGSKMCFACQLRMSLMMLYDDLFWIWNSRYRNMVQKYFGKCMGPKFSVITLNCGKQFCKQTKNREWKRKEWSYIRIHIHKL